MNFLNLLTFTIFSLNLFVNVIMMKHADDNRNIKANRRITEKNKDELSISIFVDIKLNILECLISI